VVPVAVTVAPGYHVWGLGAFSRQRTSPDGVRTCSCLPLPTRASGYVIALVTASPRAHHLGTRRYRRVSLAPASQRAELRSGEVALFALEARARFRRAEGPMRAAKRREPCASADRLVDRPLGRSHLESTDETPCQRAEACPCSTPGVSALASATAPQPAPRGPRLLRASPPARGIIAVIARSNQVLAVDQSEQVAADVATQPSAVTSA
jgi:hypothetical protein